MLCSSICLLKGRHILLSDWHCGSTVSVRYEHMQSPPGSGISRVL